ncbi:GNAT family N-acetyltransferase [Brevundimonas sp. C43]|uniref:GNAT family N-acetyltransferase n=1 Tax=Brevundimonas sp. C43 TaxID=3068314 RepID=UPI00273DE285|nr:GNAT family N-acetyltransferase [Brevundimonas sp. C43]
MIRVEDADPDHADASVLIAALSQRLAAITGSSGQASFDADDVRGPGAAFLLARDEQGRPIGCGALRPLQPGVAEIKRIYAAVSGQGIGSAVLAALEARAKSLGYEEIRLETRRVNTTAVGFYGRAGYRECPPYGRYIGCPEAICFAKPVVFASV